MGYPMNPEYQKSILKAYSTLGQSAVTGAYLDYDNVDILTGCSVKYVAGTPGIVLAKPGIYELIINNTAAAAETESGTAEASTEASTTENTTDITVAIQNNGELIPGAKTTATSTGPDDKVNLSLSTIIKVRPSCCAIDNTARISVVNTGIPAEYTDANITVIKLC